MKNNLINICLLAVVFLVGALAHARIKVAFLEVYDFNGKLVQYEPESRFGHSALQVGNLWLQSYPGEGVQLITFEKLQKRGKVAVILDLPGDISAADYQKYLGLLFDFYYSWSDDSLYCSELLAKVLHIGPMPMHFNHAVWPPHYWPLENQPGMSPDKLFRILSGPGPLL